MIRFSSFAFLIVGFFFGALTDYYAFSQTRNVSFDKTALQEEVTPKNGVQMRISLGDAIPKLVEAGVIDVEKFEALYKRRGGLSEEQKLLLTQPSAAPIRITHENALFLVNLLWPLGLANKTQVLSDSPAAAPDTVSRLASTAGWTLGKNPDGASYYNSVSIVPLTTEQEALVQRVAERIFRPCCNNPTSFPDCNHGAALLGMLELGAYQGLSEEELFSDALALNSFWFPDHYLKMALLFQAANATDWNSVDPKIALSSSFSSGRGFRANVLQPLSLIPGVFLEGVSGESCGA